MTASRTGPPLRAATPPLLAALLALFPPAARAAEPVVPPVGGPLAELHTELVERVGSGELPSAAVAVLRGDEVLWLEALGWADRELEVRATPATPYGLASVGKSITATAVMTLVECGAVRLDDLAAPHLAPGALWSPAGWAGEVRVRHLLQMTAAIPHGNYTYLDGADAARLTAETLVAERGLVVHPPGEVYMYSNFSYAMLERLIETASGASYGDFVRRTVFEPLGH
mgnify:FL=1